jgi:hypothetical protein
MGEGSYLGWNKILFRVVLKDSKEEEVEFSGILKLWMSCRRTKEVSILEQHHKHSITQPELFHVKLFDLPSVYQ